MFEAQVKEAREKLTAALELTKQDMEAGIQQLAALCEDIGNIIPMESTEYYVMSCNVYGITGDFYVRGQKPAEAEKCFKEMVKAAAELVKRDEEQYDFQLATAYYKLASLGRLCMNIVNIPQKPVVLDEKQTKVYDTVVTYYKLAMQASMAKAKKGQIQSVEFHSACLDQLAIMYGTVGNYKDAIMAEEQAIKLDKAVYEKRDDCPHCVLLAGRMNTLSMLYGKLQKIDKVLETLEDSVFVLEEHEEEDPVRVGILLGRHCMNLAGAYAGIKEEADKAPEMFRKGVEKIEAVNRTADNGYLTDIIMSNFLAGQYFFMTRHPEPAKLYLTRAIEAEQQYEEKNGRTDMKSIAEQAQKYLGM